MTTKLGQPSSSGGSIYVRVLRVPTRSEIIRLASIFDSYRAHYGEVIDESQTVAWLEANLIGGRLQAFTAESGGEFIGFALTMAVPASLRLGHFWQIRDLFVVPSHRRLGIGGALLESISAAAITAGASRLSLQTESDNTPALRLYAKSGYTIVEGFHSLLLTLNPDIDEN